MNNAQCRKAYVSVNVDVDEEGTIHPCIRQRQLAGVFPHHQCRYEQPPDLL